MKHKKIIFLDIDGVLNSTTWAFNNRMSKPRYNIDPLAADVLADIINATGASVVISSSWKFMGIEMLKTIWDEFNMPGEIVGLTPDGDSDEALLQIDDGEFSKLKGLEIREWLLSHPQCADYVIIDDEDVALEEQKERFVRINPQYGLRENDRNSIIRILIPDFL